jgi:hypothetical protein
MPKTKRSGKIETPVDGIIGGTIDGGFLREHDQAQLRGVREQALSWLDAKQKNPNTLKESSRASSPQARLRL